MPQHCPPHIGSRGNTRRAATSRARAHGAPVSAECAAAAAGAATAATSARSPQLQRPRIDRLRRDAAAQDGALACGAVGYRSRTSADVFFDLGCVDRRGARRRAESWRGGGQGRAIVAAVGGTAGRGAHAGELVDRDAPPRARTAVFLLSFTTSSRLLSSLSICTVRVAADCEISRAA